MYDPRIWTFISDMNFDGSITISDVWLWFKWLFFYPGDGLVYLLINKLTGLANFFEITYDNYGGVLSGIVSFFAWIFIWGVYLILIEINFFSQNPGTEIEKNNLEDTSREV